MVMAALSMLVKLIDNLSAEQLVFLARLISMLGMWHFAAALALCLL